MIIVDSVGYRKKFNTTNYLVGDTTVVPQAQAH